MPPQSTSVSVPFLTVSVQLGATHAPPVQASTPVQYSVSSHAVPSVTLVHAVGAATSSQVSQAFVGFSAPYA